MQLVRFRALSGSIALSRRSVKSATISTGKLRMETSGKCLRRPRSGRGVMRGRWRRRSGPLGSLLWTIEVGQSCPSVPATELMVKLLDTPRKGGSEFVGLAHGESRFDRLFPEPKQTANRKTSCSDTALSIFRTSQMGDQDELEPDCILALAGPVFIHRRSDFESDSSRTDPSDKGRMSVDPVLTSFADRRLLPLRYREGPQR